MTFIDLLVLAMGGYAMLMLYTLSRPRSPTVFFFFLVLLISLAWDLTYYLELVLPALETKRLVHIVRFIFLPWLTISWLAMICRLLGVGRWLPRWFWAGFIVFNVASVIVAVTSGYHQWFQYDFTIHPVGEYGVLIYSKGPWYLFYEFFHNLVAWFCLILMISAWPGATGRTRKTLPLLIAGFAVPLLMNTLLAMNASLVPNLNLAPFTTIISVTVFAWVVLGYRALDIIPVARGVLLDNMRELVFVTDRNERLVDMNKAAQTAMEPAARTWLGRRAMELPAPWGSYFQSRAEGGEAGSVIVEVEKDGQRLIMEGSTLDLREESKRQLGKLHIFRDVTAEREHQQQQLAYQRMLEERKYLRQQELLIRDLHDGMGGIVAGIGMISALALKERDAGQRDVALRKIMDLAAEGNVEVRSLMNTLESRELLWPDLIVEMRRHGAMFQDNHGIRVNFSAEGEGDAGGPGLFPGLSLFRIFKEALNNVAKHAGASRVSVTLSLKDEHFQLVIKDDGKGLSQAGGVPPGRGFRNMRQRIEELGGTMTTDGGPGLQLSFEAALPLKSPDQGMPMEGDLSGIVERT